MSPAQIVIRTLATALAVLFFASGASTAAQEYNLSVTVKTKARVKSEKIFLRDIAIIKGPDSALKKDLSEVYIAKAPSPGQSINIRKDYITRRLQITGLPLSLAGWSLPRMVKVTRESQIIKRKLIKKIFKDYLTVNTAYRERDWELVKLQTGKLPCLPAGSLTYKIVPCPSANPSRLTLIIYFFVDGVEAGNVRVIGQINLFEKILIAAQTIEKGQVIRDSDVKMARFNLSRLRQPGLSSPEQAVGQVCRRVRILPGEPILSRDLSKRIDVKKGDIITIMVDAGTLRVSTIGKAKKDGAIGDRIPVLNLDSKKVVTARLVSPNLARVDLYSAWGDSR